MSAPLVPNAPTRILMTADTIGGVWTYATDLARGLCPLGTQVILATMGRQMSAAQRSEAAQIDGLRVVESTFKLEWMESPWTEVDAAGAWLLELEHRFAPDIVHLNGYAHGALPFRAPKLVVAHSCVLSWWQAVKGTAAPGEWEMYRQRVQQGLRGASQVVAPTRAMLAAVHEIYGTLPSSRVIHNGRSLPVPTTGTSKQPIIFSAGRLGDEAKNISALGAAAANLDWGVFVAGAEGDESGRAPLPANVHHCGKLPPSEIARWMSAASIYCLPARYEPFGLSVLEAAMSGCALVLGDIPSLQELWSGAAHFVPPDDSAELHHVLRALIDDPGTRNQLATAARERAAGYSVDRFINSYLGVYRELGLGRTSTDLAAA